MTTKKKTSSKKAASVIVQMPTMTYGLVSSGVGKKDGITLGFRPLEGSDHENYAKAWIRGNPWFGGEFSLLANKALKAMDADEMKWVTTTDKKVVASGLPAVCRITVEFDFTERAEIDTTAQAETVKVDKAAKARAAEDAALKAMGF